jgi:hypothetical protein
VWFGRKITASMASPDIRFSLIPGIYRQGSARPKVNIILRFMRNHDGSRRLQGLPLRLSVVPHEKP